MYLCIIIHDKSGDGVTVASKKMTKVQTKVQQEVT